MSKLKEIQGELASNLKRLRENFAPEECRSINRFAKWVGIGNNAVEMIEGGKGNPRLDTLVQIAEKFRMEPWHLLVKGASPANIPAPLSVEDRETIQRAAELIRRATPVHDEVLALAPAARIQPGGGKRTVQRFRRNREK